MICPRLSELVGCWYNVVENPAPQAYCCMMVFTGGLEYVPRWCLPRGLG